MSILLLARVFSTPMESSTDKIVLLALSDHAWDDGSRCYPSAQRIADHCSLSRRAVFMALKRLEAAEYLIRHDAPSPIGTVMWTINMARLSSPRQSVHPPSAPDSQGGMNVVHSASEPHAPNPLFTPQKQPSGNKMPSAPTGTEWPSPQALVAMYNERAPDNVPAVESLSPGRKEKAWRALRQWPEKTWWAEVFSEYRKSRFLSGKVPPSNGHATFRPDFDWLLSRNKDGTENAVKVHDGAYSD